MDSLKKIKEWAEEIQGQWNGDESGLQEDAAMQAQDILDTIAELEKLIKEMDEILL